MNKGPLFKADEQILTGKRIQPTCVRPQRADYGFWHRFVVWKDVQFHKAISLFNGKGVHADIYGYPQVPVMGILRVAITDVL